MYFYILAILFRLSYTILTAYINTLEHRDDGNTCNTTDVNRNIGDLSYLLNPLLTGMRIRPLPDFANVLMSYLVTAQFHNHQHFLNRSSPDLPLVDLSFSVQLVSIA